MSVRLVRTIFHSNVIERSGDLSSGKEAEGVELGTLMMKRRTEAKSIYCAAVR